MTGWRLPFNLSNASTDKKAYAYEDRNLGKENDPVTKGTAKRSYM